MAKEEKRPPWRPREHDREEIAVKMVEWAYKDDSFNLCGFCGEEQISPCKISQWANQCEDFRKAYTLTKALLGDRRERGLKEGKVHQKAYDLNARTYDKPMHEQWELEEAYKAGLKIKQLQAEIATLEQIKKDMQDGNLSQK